MTEQPIEKPTVGIAEEEENGAKRGPLVFGFRTKFSFNSIRRVYSERSPNIAMFSNNVRFSNNHEDLFIEKLELLLDRNLKPQKPGPKMKDK